MKTKLKDIQIDSVDLVDRGANQDAYIRLFKRYAQEDKPNTGEHTADKNTAETINDETVGKNRQEDESKMKEVCKMKIDKSMMTQEDAKLFDELVKKYGEAPKPGNSVNKADENSDPAGNAPDTGEMQNEQVGKFTGESDNNGGNTAINSAADNSSETNVTKIHPEVQKALNEYQELAKKQASEIEELRKSLEIEKFTADAAKYEVLGKKREELAAKFYDLKKVGGSVYDDYVAVLDESLEILKKSGLFREVGSSRQGSADALQAINIKAAELAKSAENGMTNADTFIRAYETNPELAARYESEYMNRR